MNRQATAGRRSKPWPAAVAAALLVGSIAGCRSRSTPVEQEAPAAGNQDRSGDSRATREANAPELLAVPLPDLSTVDELVREQIRDRRSSLAALRQRADVPADELAAAYGEMGMLYHTYQFFDAAEGCHRNARALAPDVFRWAYYLGIVYRAKDQPDQAVVALESALGLRRDSVPTLVTLADTHLLVSRPDRAEALYRRALEVDASCAAAMVGLGKIAALRRDFAAAVPRFEAALRRQPDATAIHYSLGMAYRGMGDLSKAQAHLKKRGEAAVLFADPLMTELRQLRTGAPFREKHGVSAGKAGKLPLAIDDLRKAVELDGDNASAHLNLGTALAISGDVDAAIEQFREALRLKPGYARAHCNLAIVMAGQGSTEEALKHFRSAIQSDPRSFQAHLGLADLSAQTGDHELAASHYAIAVDIDPRHRVARLGQALALIRTGRYAEARARLEEARAVLPKSMTVAHALARLLAACPDEATRDGPRALELALAVFRTRNSVDHAETVAMAYAEVGKYDEAKRWQARAIAAAEGARHDDLLPRLRANLALYESRKPCRVPWPDEARNGSTTPED